MIGAAETLALTRAHESSAANTFRLGPAPPVFVGGEGAWLTDASGARWLDLVCGSATTNLGHGHPAHRRAIEAALATGVLHTGTRLPSPFRAELLGALAGILPPGLDRIQLVNSGAEAVEAAIKAAQFATGRRRLVAFAGGYHGRTLGALSLTSGDRIRAPFGLLDALVDVLPYPAAEDPSDGPLAAAEALFTRRAAEGDAPALCLVEAVQGVSGLVGPNRAFLEGLRRLTRRFALPLGFDEIWTGFGRTGAWFAFQHAGVAPDVVVMGKALSGGLPLSAVAASEAFLGRWPPGMHTSTFQGNPLACAMAVATIATLRDERLVERAAQTLAPMMAAALAPLRARPQVASVRALGAWASIAFHEPARAQKLLLALQEARILAYGGGSEGECVMLLPPLTIEASDLAGALDAVAALA